MPGEVKDYYVNDYITTCYDRKKKFKNRHGKRKRKEHHRKHGS